MTMIDLPSDAPIVESSVTLRSVSQEVADRVLRPQAPRWWWIGFGISLVLFLTLFSLRSLGCSSTALAFGG